MSHLGILHKQIDASFNEDELQSLCMDLDVDYDLLQSRSKSGKARELILYLRRRDALDTLFAQLQSSRPRINWFQLIDSEELATQSAAHLANSLAAAQSESQPLYQAVQQQISKQETGLRSIWERFLDNPEKRLSSLSEILEDLFESDLSFAQLLHQLLHNEKTTQKGQSITVTNYGQIGQVISAEHIENIGGNVTFGSGSGKETT